MSVLILKLGSKDSIVFALFLSFYYLNYPTDKWLRLHPETWQQGFDCFCTCFVAVGCRIHKNANHHLFHPFYQLSLSGWSRQRLCWHHDLLFLPAELPPGLGRAIVSCPGLHFWQHNHPPPPACLACRTVSTLLVPVHLLVSAVQLRLLMSVCWPIMFPRIHISGCHQAANITQA